MVNSDKIGHRAAQRLEAISEQAVPSAIDSVVKAEEQSKQNEGKMTDRASHPTPDAEKPPTRRIVTGLSVVHPPFPPTWEALQFVH